MKKKILLLLAVIALFACLFAISVSAEGIVANTVTSETYGTVYQLNQDPGLDNAHLYVSTLNNIENQGKDTESMAIITDGTYYYVFPASYLVDEYTNGKLSFTVTKGAGSNFSSKQKGINDALGEWASAEGVTFPTFATRNAWGNTCLDFMVRLEVPSDVTYIDRNHCLIRGTGLIEVRFTTKINLNGAGGLFSGSTALTTVTGLENCTNVKNAASMFSGCTSLVSVKLPTDVTSIPNDMFNGCKAFTGVENWDEIKNNITSIGQYAFNECDSLVSISLPSVTSIGKRAFAYSDSLESVDLKGAPLTSVSDAFRNCTALLRMELPDTVTSISQDGFHGCSSLVYINIPRDCTEIGNYGLYNCSSLEVVDMSNATALTKTNSHTFVGCDKIKELHFPEGFTTFGGISCGALTSITFPDSTISLGVIKGAITEFKVPLGVTKLIDKQFDYCSSLKTVTIHKGVTSISTTGNTSFFGTTKSNLTTIIYTGSENDDIVTAIKTVLPKATIEYGEHCEVYLGGHAMSGDVKVTVNNYFETVYVGDSCTRADCGKSVVTNTIAPIFTWKGYSKSTYGESYSVVQGFGVNQDSVEAYKVYAPDFDFGILAAVNKTGEAITPKVGDEGVLTSNFDKKKNDYLDIKVTGIPADNLATKVVFCVYVTVGDKMYYLDGGVTDEAVVGISYSQING